MVDPVLASVSCVFLTAPEKKPSFRAVGAWFAAEDVRTLIEQGEVPDGLSLSALGLAFTLGRL